MHQVSPDPILLTPETLFFSVSIRKLIVMSVATCGLYQLYWFYRNWKAAQLQMGASYSPPRRAIFALYWCLPLFERIIETATNHGLKVRLSPRRLAGAWCGFVVFASGWHQFWYISLLSVLPLAVIQTTCNELNRVVAPQRPVNDRFTVANIVGIILGIIALAIAVARGWGFV